MKLILKYLGYFALVFGVAASIYKIGGFFAGMQSDISQIKGDNSIQKGEITIIKSDISIIKGAQAAQKTFNMSIDQSYQQHLKRSKQQLDKAKELIDEYTEYLELKIGNEKKKSSTDSLEIINFGFTKEKIK